MLTVCNLYYQIKRYHTNISLLRDFDPLVLRFGLKRRGEMVGYLFTFCYIPVRWNQVVTSHSATEAGKKPRLTYG